MQLGHTIEDVKLEIQYRERIPAEKQRLLFADQQLKDHRTIKGCNIQNVNTLYLELIWIIFVRISTEKAIKLKVAGDDTIKKVKKAIYDKENILPDHQQLSFANRELIDGEATLIQCHIKESDTLDLVVRTQETQIPLNEKISGTTASATIKVDDVDDQLQTAHRVTDMSEEPDIMLLPIEGYENKPLVSLEEAIVPLIPLVPDVKRKAWIAKSRAVKLADGLTTDQSASIILYSMEWPENEQSLYHILNSTLRAEKRSLLKPWFLYLKLILTALVKLPSIEGRTFYRGVKKNLSNTYRPGKIIVWWGFSSCTATIDVLEKEEFLGKSGTRTLFAIECKSGKDIRDHSMYPNENEVLLMPAIQFKVIGQYQPCSDVYMIQLKETKPLYPLRDPV